MATILVCTRAEDVLAELGPVLRGEHLVAVVPGVAEAVRALLSRRFDAVVLDWAEAMAPMAPARDLLPVIARLQPRRPILTVVPPAASVEAEAAIRAAGVCCLLVRPLAPGELDRHLAAALRWAAAAPPSLTRPFPRHRLRAEDETHKPLPAGKVLGRKASGC